MTIPWGPLACLAGALVVAMLYKRFMPVEHHTIRSPIFWVFLLVGTFVFGGLAFSSLPQQQRVNAPDIRRRGRITAHGWSSQGPARETHDASVVGYGSWYGLQEMRLDSIDVNAFHRELDDVFRDVSLHSGVVASFPFVTLTINGAPEEITILFEQNAVIQAGHFTTEACYEQGSFAEVVRELVLMAQNGYHAQQGPTGLTSSLGQSRWPHGALTSAAPWPYALKA